LNHFGGLKNQSFGNNSGKPQAIRTKFSTRAQVKDNNNVQEILGAIGEVGAKWSRITPAKSEFFVTNTTFRQLPNNRFSPDLAMTRESMSLRNVSEGIFAKFPNFRILAYFSHIKRLKYFPVTSL